MIAIENTRLLNELRQRTDDLSESLEQQTATSEVLNVISSSLSDAQPVFDAIVQSGMRLFPDAAVFVALPENGMIKAAAMAEKDQARAEGWKRRFPFPLSHDYMHGVAILNRAVVDISDVRKAPPELAVGAKNFLKSGYLAVTIVPMMRGDAAIGALSVVRLTPGPLSNKQLAVLKNFAAQAVIAIENTRLLSELRQRTDDLTESLEQQTATSDVLKVISSSPGELEPVFSAVLENATRICGANFGVLFLSDGDGFRTGAMHNAPAALAEVRRREPLYRPPPNTAVGRMARTKRAVHVADILAEKNYFDVPPGYSQPRTASFGGARTVLAVPMLKDDELVGAINIYRQEVQPFTDKQVELLANFAAQAVIAIENARLLNELRQRTDDLTESLEQQTAISDILRVISNSPSDVKPVFETVAERAARICEARFVDIVIADDDKMSVAATFGDLGRPLGEVIPLDRSTVMGRSICDKQPVHLHDQQNVAEKEYPLGREFALKYGHRTIMGVPLLREGRALGTILVRRTEVRPFEDRHVALVKTFADQAAIAIENARLFNELRQRTDDLTESLQQQTATADVLKVISRSAFDLQTVLDTLTTSAAQLCEADMAGIVRPKAGEHYWVTSLNFPPAFTEIVKARPILRNRGSVAGRALVEGHVVHIPDVLADAEFTYTEAQKAGGYRTVLGVPLLREGTPIGVIVLTRVTVRPFTDKQIELLSTFADQAVIAIENVRLFDEVQARTEELSESLQQQTATADVLKVISRSTFDLPAVLKTLVSSAAQLCDANKAQILRPTGKDDGYYSTASYGHTLEFDAHMKTLAFPPGKGSVVGRVQLARKSVHIADVLDDPEYTALETQRLGGYRTHLAVPLLRQGSLIGVLVVSSTTVRPFDRKHIELIETFADQAVIAIENVRLFDEVQRRTEELGESLQQQTATADVLKVISRSTFDLKTVLDTLLKSAAQLCDADQGTITQRKGEAFYRSVAYGFPDAFLEYVKDQPVEANRKTGTGRALAEGKVVHIPDVHNDPEFDWPEAQKLGGFRTMLGVPMLREGEPVGVLTLTRADVRPFTEKQIELVATFADQAAIAIENVRLFDEIQDKSRQLAEASQHKSQFLANMSHELRTPLNAILGYTELIMDGIYGDTPDKMRDTLERVQRNGKHLLGLINDVLDLSKIEAGQLALSLGDYSLRQVVHDVYGAVESLAANKHIGLKVEMPNELPQGWGDERRLTQVLLNLVGNAIKFTDKGEVVIAASATNGSFLVAVRDTGPGISKSDQGKIFDEFQQADNSLTKAKGGTGLGLAIARRIMELHGGRLWVESEVGSGSTFTFTLPVEIEKQMRQA